MNGSERDDSHLGRTLRALAEVEAAVEAPPAVEDAVMARWDASRRGDAKADRSRSSRVVRGAAAVAAGVTLVGVLGWPRGVQTPDTSGDAGTDGVTYTTVGVVGGPLMAGEPVRVVRMRVVRSALSELGVAAAGQTETVDIEVLVGEDGVARGVRVPISEL